MSKQMKRLNIGCGNLTFEEHTNLDKIKLPGVDCVFDLETCADGMNLPFSDNYFDEVNAIHILEHIKNILPLMQELHRVTKPGCLCLIRVPHGSSDSAHDDPTHVRQFYPKTFTYFGQPNYHRADYGYRGDWEIQECVYIVKKSVKAVMKERKIPLPFAVHHIFNTVDEILCAMKCIKPIREPLLELQEAVTVNILVT